MFHDPRSKVCDKKLKRSRMAEKETSIRTIFDFLRRNRLLSPGRLYPLARQAYYLVRIGGFRQIRTTLDRIVRPVVETSDDYEQWLNSHGALHGDGLNRMEEAVLKLTYKPLFCHLNDRLQYRWAGA